MFYVQFKNIFSVSMLFSLVLGPISVARAEVALDRDPVTSVAAPQTVDTSYIMEEVDPYAIRIFQNRCVVEGQVAPKGFLSEALKNCTKTLVTNGDITVISGDRSLRLKPTTQGVVSLPLSQVGYIETASQSSAIVWQYAGASITTHANSNPEQKQSTIKKYLETLSDTNLFSIQLSELSDFDKSASKLKDKIRESMPKYYNIERVANNDGKSATDHVAYQLVPIQQRMYYTYGDFTGNAELPIIVFKDFPPAVLIKTSIINSLLPAYQNEDGNIIVTYKDEAVRVTNKTTESLQLDRLSLSYNGTFVDNLLVRPLKLSPSATSNEISVADAIERKLALRAKQNKLSAQEAQQLKINFGFGAIYHDLQAKATARTSLVNTYSVYELAKNGVETARLDEHMALLANDRNFSQSESNIKAEFDTGKFTIKKGYLNNLQTVGVAMQKDSNTKLVVEGHTDNVGDKKMNQRLSERRALAIKQYLVQNFGINTDRIQTKGYGLSRPVADNVTSGGRAKNRRANWRYMEAGL